MKRFVRWTVLSLLVVVIAGFVAHHFLWFRSYKAEVNCGGARVASARVYHNRGEVLVVLREPNAGAYVISERENALGVPMSGFWLKTGGAIALNRSSVVWFKGGVANRYDPKLRVSGATADFEDYTRQSYHLQW